MKRIVLIGIILPILAGGCAALNKKFGLINDNPIEEFIEYMIKDKTGADIDFTLDEDEQKNVCSDSEK